MQTEFSENFETSPTLESLFLRDSVEDIHLSPRGVSFYENGKWDGPYPALECSLKELWAWAQNLAERAQVQLGLTQPSVDSTIEYSARKFLRAHVVVPPLAPDGPEITLRRLPHLERFKLDNFDVSASHLNTIITALRSGKSFLISGSTGSGKTSFVTALLREIPSHERLVVLEDSPEIPLPSPLSTKLVCRSDRFGFREGASWTLEDLVFESLRMRPDRIIVGECRSREANAIAKALQTGHRGVWTTIHASSCNEALARFASLAQREPEECGWDLVVQLGKNSQGLRRVEDVWKRKEPA